MVFFGSLKDREVKAKERNCNWKETKKIPNIQTKNLKIRCQFRLVGVVRLTRDLRQLLLKGGRKQIRKVRVPLMDGRAEGNEGRHVSDAYFRFDDRVRDLRDIPREVELLHFRDEADEVVLAQLPHLLEKGGIAFDVGVELLEEVLLGERPLGG